MINIAQLAAALRSQDQNERKSWKYKKKPNMCGDSWR